MTTSAAGTTAIALCADDYAQHRGIDDAVCALLEQRRLSAVSCMSTAPRWKDQSAPRLREQAAGDTGADIGLHLNLTESFGARQISLGGLIVKSYTQRLDVARLCRGFARQFDAFETAMGRAPDFVDGHQHVHQLPRVAEAVMELLQQRYGARMPWVRNTVPARGVIGAKPALLHVLGGSALARRLKECGIATNAGFGGVYGFDSNDYGALFGEWLAGSEQGTLLACHPAASTHAHDPIGHQRLVEYRFFSSDAFPALLAAHEIRLAALSSLLPLA